MTADDRPAGAQPASSALPAGDHGLKATSAPQRVAHGAALMLLFKLVDRAIGFASVLLLARLLTPADFGLVAMAMSVVALTELMSAFGFETALIQRPDAGRAHFDTAWTFQAIFGVATAMLLVALAVPAASFYRDPRITLILPALAVGALLQGVENIGPVMFRKSLDYRREFVFLMAKRLSGFIVTVALALVFRNFWALVAGNIAGRLAATAISYMIHDYRPRLTLAARDDLMHFSKWLFLSNLMLFAQSNADKFILGRTIGARQLGLYNVAAEIAAMPSTALIAPINRAVYPAYARLAADLPALREQFLSVYGHIAFVAIPISIAIACTASQVVGVLLGPQWIDAIPLLQLFVVAGLASALHGNVFSIIVAMGHPKINTMINGVVLLVSIPALIVASIYHGAIGAAWAQIGMAVMLQIPLYTMFFRLTGTRKAAVTARLWRPLLGSLLMAMAMVALLRWPPLAGASAVLQLAAASVLGAVVYLAAVAALWTMSGRPQRSAEASWWDRVLNITHRLRRGPRADIQPRDNSQGAS